MEAAAFCSAATAPNKQTCVDTKTLANAGFCREAPSNGARRERRRRLTPLLSHEGRNLGFYAKGAFFLFRRRGGGGQKSVNVGRPEERQLGTVCVCVCVRLFYLHQIKAPPSSSWAAGWRRQNMSELRSRLFASPLSHQLPLNGRRRVTGDQFVVGSHDPWVETL